MRQPHSPYSVVCVINSYLFRNIPNIDGKTALPLMGGRIVPETRPPANSSDAPHFQRLLGPAGRTGRRTSVSQVGGVWASTRAKAFAGVVSGPLPGVDGADAFRVVYAAGDVVDYLAHEPFGR
jgi:hypothetical protein